MSTNPLALARDLIRCPSVTPADEGALGVLMRALEALGFRCHPLEFSAPGTADVHNLYARREGNREGRGPNFCFAGHTDVVPAGDPDGWTVAPFEGAVVDECLYGRGAADMKGAIACFVAATARFLESRGGTFPGSISLLITGDEEGSAINGTVKVLEWLAGRGEKLDACLVGEPTNQARLGEAVKIGRRGSMNGRLVVFGTEGHSAYPDLADNPIPRMLRMLGAITGKPLDEGSRHFQPSNLVITSIDVGNPAPNVIPARAEARFNIRFNDLHSGATLERWLKEAFDAVHGNYQLEVEICGAAFMTEPGDLGALLCDSVSRVTGERPQFSTSGGTSDARFIHHHCSVVDFGLVGATAHQADERASLADMEALSEIYLNVLDGFFAPR